MPRIWIADYQERPAFAAPLQALVGYEWVTDSAQSGVIPANIDLVVVTDERALPWIVPTLRSCRTLGIPSLHIVDGITDWRNCFDNPTFDLTDAPAPKLFCPVVADKIACLGIMQCLLLDHFGNGEQTENAGSLRLDAYARSLAPTVATPLPQRVLVTTARTPAFTTQQRDALYQLFATLRDALASPALPPIEITWRLPSELAAELGVPNSQTTAAGGEFHSALKQSDVLLTTASTTLLEGMLSEKPTVLLDPYGTPTYLDAAWTIRQHGDIAAVLRSALAPTQELLIHQRFLRDLSLQLGTAEERHRRLIDTLIAAGERSRRTKTPLELPPRILPLGDTARDPRLAVAHLENPAANSAEVAQLRRQSRLDREQIIQLQTHVLQLKAELASQLSIRLRHRIWQALRSRFRL